MSGLPFFGFLTKLTLMTIIPLVGVFIILFPRAKVDDFNKNRYNFSVAVAMTALVLIVISTWVQAPLSLIYAPLMAIIFGITVNKLSLGVKNIVKYLYKTKSLGRLYHTIHFSLSFFIFILCYLYLILISIYSDIRIREML